MSTMAEQQVIKQAVKERWPVSNAARLAAVKDTEKIINDPSIEAKLRMTAVRNLLEMDKVNLKETEIRDRRLPKHVIHTNLSTEDLLAEIQRKAAALGISPDQLQHVPMKRIEAKSIIDINPSTD